MAVIGGDANIATAQSGAPFVKPTYTVSPVQGITKVAKANGIRSPLQPGHRPAQRRLDARWVRRRPVRGAEARDRLGCGLTAQFWTSTDPSGTPDVTRVEKQVNYDVALLSASDGLRSSQVTPPPAANTQTGGAAVYRGTITPPTSGTYRFSLSGWGSATLTIDGQARIDMTGADGYRTLTSDPLQLTAGHAYADRGRLRRRPPAQRHRPRRPQARLAAPGLRGLPGHHRRGRSGPEVLGGGGRRRRLRE